MRIQHSHPVYFEGNYIDQIKEIIYCDKDKNIIQKIVFSYDDKKRIKNEIFFDKDGVITNKWEHNYDDESKTRTSKFYENDMLIEEVTYKTI